MVSAAYFVVYSWATSVVVEIIQIWKFLVSYYNINFCCLYIFLLDFMGIYFLCYPER